MRDTLPDGASSARPAVAGSLEPIGMRGGELPLVRVDVRHAESLHAHDAVAMAGPPARRTMAPRHA